MCVCVCVCAVMEAMHDHVNAKMDAGHAAVQAGAHAHGAGARQQQQQQQQHARPENARARKIDADIRFAGGAVSGVFLHSLGVCFHSFDTHLHSASILIRRPRILSVDLLSACRPAFSKNLGSPVVLRADAFSFDRLCLIRSRPTMRLVTPRSIAARVCTSSRGWVLSTRDPSHALVQSHPMFPLGHLLPHGHRVHQVT